MILEKLAWTCMAARTPAHADLARRRNRTDISGSIALTTEATQLQGPTHCLSCYHHIEASCAAETMVSEPISGRASILEAWLLIAYEITLLVSAGGAVKSKTSTRLQRPSSSPALSTKRHRTTAPMGPAKLVPTDAPASSNGRKSKNIDPIRYGGMGDIPLHQEMLRLAYKQNDELTRSAGSDRELIDAELRMAGALHSRSDMKRHGAPSRGVAISISGTPVPRPRSASQLRR